nr:hypothetical protein [Tanacetum cinerariifolium]
STPGQSASLLRVFRRGVGRRIQRIHSSSARVHPGQSGGWPGRPHVGAGAGAVRGGSRRAAQFHAQCLAVRLDQPASARLASGGAAHRAVASARAATAQRPRTAAQCAGRRDTSGDHRHRSGRGDHYLQHR